MKKMLLASVAVLLSLCGGVFDVHPYDVDVSGETGINKKQIAVIESKFANKRIRFNGIEINLKELATKENGLDELKAFEYFMPFFVKDVT